MHPAYDPSEVLQSKEQFFNDPAPPRAVSPVLLKSWERSRSALGSPERVRGVPQTSLDALDPHLADIFHAPLTRISGDLIGSGIAVLLADAQGRILQRWSEDRAALAHLDGVGTIQGADLGEEAVGTNGVGTVALEGRPLQITGEEHFASFYARAVCTGAPVFHPLSRKLLAVITFSSDVFERSILLRPLVTSVAARLEQQLLDAERPDARRVLAEFLKAKRLHSGPVIAFGPEGLVMQSRRTERFTAADLTTIERSVVDRRRDERYVLELSTGNVGVQFRPVNDGDGYVVALDSERTSMTPTIAIGPTRMQLVGRDPEWLNIVHVVAKHREARRPLLIAGEVSSGKTTLAAGLPYREQAGPSPIVNAAERHVLGSRKWLQRVSDRLRAGAPVVIRGVETLDQSCLDALAALLDLGGGGSMLVTMSTDAVEQAETMSKRLGMSMVWVPALRDRAVDIPLLWRMFATLLAPGAGLEPRPETLELLKAHRWPGNLRELRGIVEQMAMSGKRGPVLPSDLPDGIRSARVLPMIERVELEAIRRALAEAEGNRSRAAEILGLSRATIYRKMRAYRLIA